MADQDIEARALDLVERLRGAGRPFGPYKHCTDDLVADLVAQLIQEERDRCAEIVHVNKEHASGSTWRLLLRSYDEIKEGTRTQGGTKP